jgi:hypothetical protein
MRLLFNRLVGMLAFVVVLEIPDVARLGIAVVNVAARDQE